MFLVTEAIDGQPLSEYMKSEPENIGRAVRVIRDLSEAIQLMHNVGIENCRPAVENVMIELGENPVFWDLSPLQRDTFFGLRTYAQTYGQISEDVALGKYHVVFVDWHIVFPFYTTTVNILCCIEDLHCKGEVQHGPFTRCTSCVAPMCTECQSK